MADGEMNDRQLKIRRVYLFEASAISAVALGAVTHE